MEFLLHQPASPDASESELMTFSISVSEREIAFRAVGFRETAATSEAENIVTQISHKSWHKKYSEPNVAFLIKMWIFFASESERKDRINLGRFKKVNQTLSPGI